MMKKINTLLVIVVAVGIAWAAKAYYEAPLQQPPGKMNSEAIAKIAVQGGLVGQRRADFSLLDAVGLPHALSEWDGKIIVLNFWATWCRPCQREIPMLSQIQNHYGVEGVQVIGVAIDDRLAVEGFIEQTGIEISYQLLIGDDAAISIAMTYGNQFGVLPHTVVIDRTGVIRFSQFGEISQQQLAAWLSQLLARDGGDAD